MRSFSPWQLPAFPLYLVEQARGEKTDYDGEVLRIVGDMTRTFVDDILGTLRAEILW